jgi:putative endonuclease
VTRAKPKNNRIRQDRGENKNRRRDRGAAAHKTGHAAERLAAACLLLKGYRILARRYRTPLGEIDLVAKRGKAVVFVEVKRRGTAGQAAEAVGRANQRRVRAAAELYLQKHTEYNGLTTRFDVIVLAPRRLPQHIPDAF